MSNDTPSTTGHPVNAPDGTPATYESHVPTHREAEPIPDPGLPPHTWRPTDVDPKAEKRAERQIAAMFVAAMVFAVLFVVAYFAFEVGDNWDTFAGMGASTVASRSSTGEEAGWRISMISASAISLRARWMIAMPMSSRETPRVVPSASVDAPMPMKVSQLSPTSKAK